MSDFFEKMQKFMEIYNQRKNKKKLEIWDYHAHDTNIPCGDEVEIFVKVDEDKRIVDASYIGKGCLISQVSASLLLDYIKNMSLDKINDIDENKIKDILGLDLSPSRMKCATLSLRVLKQALASTFLLAVYPSEEGNIVGVVDKSISGKIYEEDEKILDLTSQFFQGKECTFREVVDALTHNLYTANIVGNDIINNLISYGLVKKKNIKEIAGIKYVHIYSLK